MPNRLMMDITQLSEAKRKFLDKYLLGNATQTVVPGRKTPGRTPVSPFHLHSSSRGSGYMGKWPAISGL